MNESINLTLTLTLVMEDMLGVWMDPENEDNCTHKEHEKWIDDLDHLRLISPIVSKEAEEAHKVEKQKQDAAWRERQCRCDDGLRQGCLTVPLTGSDLSLLSR